MTLKKKSAEKTRITKTKRSTANTDGRQSDSPTVGITVSVGGLDMLHESEERSRLFQGILRSTSDGILAVNRENDVLFSSERFAEMWMIPQEIMASKDDTLLLQYVLNQLSDPQAFIQKVRDLYHSDEESFDTLYFKDGRVFERLSRPMRQGTELQGRVWSFRDITERKRAENELRESEERFRTILDNLEDGYYEVDLKGTLTFVNRSYVKMLGYDENELIGMDYHQYMSQEAAKVVFQTFNRVYRSGIPERAFDWEWIRKDGTRRSIEISVSTIESADANTVGFRGIVRDVTERKQAEKILRQSEERYRSLFDRMMDGFYRSTHEGKFVDVNPAMVRLFGYSSREEMLKVNIKNELYFAPEERGSHVLDTGQEEMDVYRMRRKDGSEIWVEDHGYYIHDEQGRITHHEGMMRDITGRKQIKNELAASEAELRALFASMHDVVLVIDRQGVYRKIAPTNPGLLVKPPDELLGKNLKDIFPAEEAEAFRGNVQQVLDTKQKSQIEYQLVIGGQTMWFQTTISPLDEENTLWVAHDITNRKQAERLTDVLYEISKATYSTANANKLFQRIHHLLSSILPVNNFFIALLINEGKTLSFPYYIDEIDFSDAPDMDVHNSQSLTLEVLNTKRPLLLTEIELLDRYATGRNKLLGALPKCWVGTPLMIKGNVIGVMAIQDYHNSNAYSQKDEALLELAATQIATVIDRKRADEALRTAEANYHSIFENATVGIYQSTPQGRFLSVNPVMAHTFGYKSSEEMLSSITNIEEQYYVDPADRHEFQRLLMEQGEVHEFITRYKHKDGRQIWAQENARAVKDTNRNILHYEGFITDITERKWDEEELQRAKSDLETALLEIQQSLEREKQLAATDGLTGLYNHRHFFELAKREFHAAARHQTPLSFLMFDMDDFKQVNDAFGHGVGDDLLIKVAQTAVAQVRASDVVARYGGDEFIIMLSHANAEQVFPVAERLRASISALRLETNNEPFTITLSIGIAEMRCEPVDENVERVIQRADNALYKAKQNGRNRTVIFGQEEL